MNRMLASNAIVVEKCSLGVGVFTHHFIPHGKIIDTLHGTVVGFEETLQMKETESHCLQIASNRYIVLEKPYCFLNHSCNPNCGIDAKRNLVALQDIPAGNELFFDYATTMLERSWTMYCCCGSADCRKLIGDFDTLPLSIQKKYTQLNMVQPFIKTQLCL